jgi:hypothetical protein
VKYFLLIGNQIIPCFVVFDLSTIAHFVVRESDSDDRCGLALYSNDFIGLIRPIPPR